MVFRKWSVAIHIVFRDMVFNSRIVNPMNVLVLEVSVRVTGCDSEINVVKHKPSVCASLYSSGLEIILARSSCSSLKVFIKFKAIIYVENFIAFNL